VLKIDIVWETLASERHQRTVRIGNISGGAVAHYAVEVIHCKDVSAIHEFLNYPRWSEPLLAFVARAIESVAGALNLPPMGPLASVVCTVNIVPHGVGKGRQLAEVTAEKGTRAWLLRCKEQDAQHRRQTFVPEARSALGLLIEALSRLVWREPCLPQMPEPLTIPQHAHAGVGYVRMADVPIWVAPTFTRFMRNRVRPAVPGETDVAYARDWRMFLG